MSSLRPTNCSASDIWADHVRSECAKAVGAWLEGSVRLDRPIRSLTARELEIVKAVVQGMGNREISESLGISQFTVKHYMTRIFDKLLVANRVELALFATRQGLAQNRPR